MPCADNHSVLVCHCLTLGKKHNMAIFWYALNEIPPPPPPGREGVREGGRKGESEVGREGERE